MQKREAAAAEIKKVIGTAFVYASRDKEVLEAPSVVADLQKKEFASFGCSDCGTSMISEASMEPLCITCGSHHVEKAKAKTNINVKADSELTAIACHQCKHYNVVQSNLVTAAEHQLYCAACGEQLVLAEHDNPSEPNDTFKLNPEDEVDPNELKRIEPPDVKSSKTNVDVVPTPNGADPAVLDDTGTSPEMKTPETSAKRVESDSDEMPDNDYSDVEEAKLELAESDDEEPDEDDEPAFLKASKGDRKFLSSADFMDPVLDPGMPIVDEFDGGVIDDMAPMPYELDVGDPLMDSMSIDDGYASLSFVITANRLVAMKGAVAVATLNKKDAKANADLMGDAAFHQAIAVSAKNHGLRKSLEAFGFKPIRVKVMSQAAVNAERSKLLQESKQERSDFMKKFEHSLAIASAGFARNSWKDQPNVLLEAFVSELQAVGIRNPKPMVARVFQTAGIPYTKDLLVRTEAIMKKSNEARAALADVLAMTQETAEDMVEDDSDMDDDFDSVTSGSEVRASAIAARTIPSNQHSVSAQNVLAGRIALTFDADF